MIRAHQNPQPLQRPSVDTIGTPGRISLARRTTYVQQPGEVEIVDASVPGARKHVVATLGDVRIVGENVEKQVALKDPGDFCLLEWTGYDWTVLYQARKKR